MRKIMSLIISVSLFCSLIFCAYAENKVNIDSCTLTSDTKEFELIGNIADLKSGESISIIIYNPLGYVSSVNNAAQIFTNEKGEFEFYYKLNKEKSIDGEYKVKLYYSKANEYFEKNILVNSNIYDVINMINLSKNLDEFETAICMNSTLKNEIQPETYYGVLSTFGKNTVREKIILQNATTIDALKLALKNYSILEIFNESKEWSKLKNIFVKEQHLFSVDYTMLNKLNETNKEKAYVGLIGGSYSSFDDISKEFDEIIKALYSSQGQSATGNGGGSSSKYEYSVIQPEKDVVEANDVFKDLENHKWAYDAIYYLYQKNVISGVSDIKYEPERSITRAEFVKIIVKAFDIPVNTNELIYKDTIPNEWYYSYIQAANGANIITGKSNDYFGTNETITREDAIVILHRVLKYKNITLQINAEKQFLDKDLISNYAIEAINVMYYNGIIGGNGNGKINPKDNLTRAESAKIIYETMIKFIV